MLSFFFYKLKKKNQCCADPHPPMYLCSLPPTATDHESIYRKVVIPSLLQCISGPPITRPFTRRSSFLTSTSASLGPMIMRAFTWRSSFLTSSSASRGPPSHESIYLKVIIRPWTADAIEAIPVELPTRFQCPVTLLLVCLHLSHPAQGQAPLACLCSLYTTREWGNAWTNFLALVIFGYKESAHALLWIS